MAKVLAISASPRKGNSDTLCDEFVKGALEVGADVEKIRLGDYKIGYCKGCLACLTTQKCVQQDDAKAVIDKMAAADVICLAAQLKTLLDRTCAYVGKLANKQFVLLLTAEDRDKDAFDEILTAFNGYFRCLEGATTLAVVRGYGVLRPNEIKDRPQAMEHAYQAGMLC